MLYQKGRLVQCKARVETTALSGDLYRPFAKMHVSEATVSASAKLSFEVAGGLLV